VHACTIDSGFEGVRVKRERVCVCVQNRIKCVRENERERAGTEQLARNGALLIFYIFSFHDNDDDNDDDQRVTKATQRLVVWCVTVRSSSFMLSLS